MSRSNVGRKQLRSRSKYLESLIGNQVNVSGQTGILERRNYNGAGNNSGYYLKGTDVFVPVSQVDTRKGRKVGEIHYITVRSS